MSTEPEVKPDGLSDEPTRHAKSDPAAGGWNYRDMMFKAFERTRSARYAPALATHAGKLWCLFVNKSDNKLYVAQGTNESWSEPKVFTDGSGAAQAPALAELDGVLHAVFIENIDDSHDLVHYRYDDVTGEWAQRSGVGQHSDKPVALAAHKGQLFCAFIADNPSNTLLYVTWDAVRGWSAQKGTGEATWGTPGLYEYDGQLHLLFTENNKQRKIRDLQYDEANSRWYRVAAPPEAAEFGVSATSGAGRGFMGFLEHGDSGSVYVSFNEGHWLNHEFVNQKSFDTPVLAVLNGVVNCAFISRNDHRDLLWSQRTVPDLPLDSWMKGVSLSTKLSDLSIPGTHDSAAVSVLPFVATQNMSIVDQLNAGIRFLDLRCGLRNNQLEMFRGSYRLGITLDSLLKDVYGWLDKHGSEAIIVSIKEEVAADAASTITFAAAVQKLTDSAKNRWYQKDDTPTLNDAKGHLVLMRRYSDPGSTMGIDVSKWPDNSPRFDITTASGVQLTVQDRYNITGCRTLDEVVSDKFSSVSPILDEAIESSKDRWYLNFTSAVATGTYVAEPKPIAVGARDLWIYTPGVNVRLREYLTKRRTGRYGTIVMDFPEVASNDLITAIVQSNKDGRRLSR